MIAILTAAVLWLSAAASPIRLASQDPDARTWASWLNLVDAHIPGRRDASARRLAVWTRSDLEPVLAAISRHPNAVPIVARAIVLHTDVAMLYRNPTSYDLPASATTMTLFEDGRAVAQASGTFHWEIARSLVERLPAGAERTRIARTFYRAAGAVLQGWNENPELTAHLAAARPVLGADSVLLLYEGTQQQMYAGARAQRFFEERRRSRPDWRPTPPLAGAGGRVASRESEPPPPALPSVASARAQAERLFRRALAIDPALADARIRLAHVLDDQGRHDDAAAELSRLPHDLPPLLDYYAALVAGRVARARQDLAGARAAFERAAQIYPDTPVPQVALSEVALASGGRAASLAAIERAATSPAAATGAPDPWWAIERLHAPSAESLVEDMHRAFVH